MMTDLIEGMIDTDKTCEEIFAGFRESLKKKYIGKMDRDIQDSAEPDFMPSFWKGEEQCSPPGWKEELRAMGKEPDVIFRWCLYMWCPRKEEE